MDATGWWNAIATVTSGAVAAAVTALVAHLLAKRRSHGDAYSGRQPALVGRSGFWIVGIAIASAIVTAVTVLNPWAWAASALVALGVALAVWWLGARRRARWKAAPLVSSSVHCLMADAVSVGESRYEFGVPPLLSRVYTHQVLSETRNRDNRDADADNHRFAFEHGVPIHDVLRDSRNHIVVTGPAGVGKSTLLHHITASSWPWWRRATREQHASDAPIPKFVPLLLPATQLVGRHNIAEALGLPHRIFDTPPAPGAAWLILVDAIDEISRVAHRRDVLDTLCRHLQHASYLRSPCRYVITTRSLPDAAWRDFRFAGANEYRLNPFTDDQLRSFLERHQSGRKEDCDNPRDVQAETTRRVDAFVEAMRARGMLDIVRLPLLARLAADLYFAEHTDQAIPGRRIDIYEQATTSLLTKFDQTLETHPQETQDQVYEVLEKLGSTYKAPDRQGEASSRAVVLRKFLANIAHQALIGGQASIIDIACTLTNTAIRPATSPRRNAIETLCESTGLITDSHTRPRFIHQTFAEFLAAPYIASTYGDDPAKWNSSLANPDTRVKAVFAFAALSSEARNLLINTLIDDPQAIIQAGWIAAEDMCNESDRDAVVHGLWRQMPGSHIDDWWQPVDALGAVPTNQEHIVDVCNDESAPPFVRFAAARILYKFDQEAGLPLLLHFMQASAHTPQLYIAAAAELAKNEPSVVDALRSSAVLLMRHPNSVHWGISAAREIAPWDPQFATTLLTDATNNDELSAMDRIHAASALAEFEESGVIALREYVTGDDIASRDRCHAAILLEKFDRPFASKFLEAFITQTNDVDFDRIQAASALASYDRNGIKMLRSFASDKGVPDLLRIEAADSLTNHRRTDGINFLSSFAADSTLSSYARQSATAKLTSHDRATGLVMLQQLAQDESFDEEARVWAADSIVDRSWKPGMEALRQFCSNLTFRDSTRVSAAERIQQHSETEGTRILQRFAHDPNFAPFARVVAAIGFTRYARKPGLKLLRDFSEDKSFCPAARLEAAEGLAQADSQFVKDLADGGSFSQYDRVFVDCALDLECPGSPFKQVKPSHVPIPELRLADRICNEELPLEVRSLALVHCKRYFKNNLKSIVEMLTNTVSGRYLKARALEMLASDGDKDAPRQLATLATGTDPVPLQVHFAATSQRIAPGDGKQVLRQIVKSQSTTHVDKVRALEFLLPDAWAQNELSTLVDSCSPEQQMLTLRIHQLLASHNLEPSIQYLRQVTHDSTRDPQVRVGAIYGLVQVDPAWSAHHLATIYRDSSERLLTRAIAGQHLVAYEKAGRGEFHEWLEIQCHDEPTHALRWHGLMAHEGFIRHRNTLVDVAKSPTEPVDAKCDSAAYLAASGETFGLTMLASIASDVAIEISTRIRAAKALFHHHPDKGIQVVDTINDSSLARGMSSFEHVSYPERVVPTMRRIV